MVTGCIIPCQVQCSGTKPLLAGINDSVHNQFAGSATFQHPQQAAYNTKLAVLELILQCGVTGGAPRAALILLGSKPGW